VKTVKIALVVVALVLVGEARASIVVPPGPGNGYVYDTRLIAAGDPNYYSPFPWNGNPVEQQDKLWTYIYSSTTLDNAPVHFEIVNDARHAHELKLADNTGNFRLDAGSYELKYSIQATGGTIVEATLGVDGRTRDANKNSLVRIVKTLSTDPEGKNVVATLESTGGAGDDVVFPGVTLLYVDEVIEITDNGYVNSTTDTYVEIPEPATLVVWSVLGAMGVGLAVWRRRKPA